MTTPDRWNPDAQSWAGDNARPMGISFPTGTDPASVRARVEAMEFLLDKMRGTMDNAEFLISMNG